MAVCYCDPEIKTILALPIDDLLSIGYNLSRTEIPVYKVLTIVMLSTSPLDLILAYFPI